MNIEMGVCKECDLFKPIVNKKYYLCESCNRIRLDRESLSSSIFKCEKTKTIRKKRKSKKRYEKISKIQQVHEKDKIVYRAVFESKENKCEECNYELPNEFEDSEGRIIFVIQYSHILSKGSYCEFRYNPKNFNRLCFSCHQKWEFGDRKLMKIYERNQLIIAELLEERNSQR